MYVNIILAIRRVIKHDAKHAGRSQIVERPGEVHKETICRILKKENEMIIPAVLSSHLVTIWSTGQQGRKVRDGKAPLQVAAVRIGRRDGYKRTP